MERETSVRIVRWGLLGLRGLAIVVVLVLVAMVGLVAALTGRGLAQTSGTIRIEGLHAQVTVVRDQAGIIQIRADDPHDLFVAQGYAHAQERMWQMEVWRHISAGRLSELFGAGSVDTDTFIRTLDWRGAAQRDLDVMPQDVRDALQAYADGVNAWLADHEGSFGPPFVVAGLLAGTGGLGGYTPEPWTPLDSAAWQKVQAWNLGGNMDTEIFRLLADARLGDPARTDQLFPAYDADAPVITPSGLTGSGGAGAGGAAAAGAIGGSVATAGVPVVVSAGTASAWHDLAGLGSEVLALAGLDAGSGLVGSHGIGSNNWVVSGSRSASGGALLANDPHLGFAMPSVWIMNGLHCRVVNDGLPVRRDRRLVPRRSGGRPRPQRARRVGCDERRPGRPGPLPRDARPDRPDPLPVRGRIDPVRPPDGDHQGRRRRRRHDRGPLDATRAHPQRRRFPALG